MCCSLHKKHIFVIQHTLILGQAGLGCGTFATNVEHKTESIEVETKSMKAKTESIEAKTESIEVETKSMKAKTESIEAKTESIEVETKSMKAKTERMEENFNLAIKEMNEKMEKMANSSNILEYATDC